MTRIGMRMSEKIQLKQIINSLAPEILARNLDQITGELLFANVNTGEVAELHGTRVFKAPLKDITLEKLEKKYKRGDINDKQVLEPIKTFNHEKIEETEEIGETKEASQ